MKRHELLILLILIYHSALGQIKPNEVELEILTESITIYSDTSLYNNYDHDTYDTITTAKCDTIRVKITNKSDKRLIFTNIPIYLTFFAQLIGQIDVLEKLHEFESFNETADFSFSILYMDESLRYSRILEDPCGMAKRSLSDNEFAGKQKIDTSFNYILSEYGYLYLSWTDINNKIQSKHNIQSILILEPNSSYEWTLAYKECFLSSFNLIAGIDCYDLVLTYFQGDKIHIPDIDIPDCVPFKGCLISNNIKCSIIRLINKDQ